MTISSRLSTSATRPPQSCQEQLSNFPYLSSMLHIKLILTGALFLTLSSVIFAQKTEADYCQIIHSHVGGELEVSVTSGRVDIVTDTHAYEVEWARNWKEAIGQALWYGLQTNKKPAIVLILREVENEFKYVQQLYSTLSYAQLDEAIHVTVYPLDYE